jgi:NAD+ kinase
LKIAVYSRVIDEQQYIALQTFFDALANKNIEPLIWQYFYDQIKDKITFSSVPKTFYLDEQLTPNVECMISLGGDGTLLDTISLIQEKNIPVIGINFGRLGFLASVNQEEIQEVIDALINRNYVVEKRVMLKVAAETSLFGNVPYALNEVVIYKQDVSSMIKIHTYINGAFLCTYWADGLIIATPTGSTGYSLSCGGPIVFPDSASFVITPIAPHNLNVRPLIIPDSSVLSFEIEGRMEHYICSLDARRETVQKSTQIAITKQSFPLQLIRLHENSFLSTIRNKLLWGVDKRN